LRSVPVTCQVGPGLLPPPSRKAHQFGPLSRMHICQVSFGINLQPKDLSNTDQWNARHLKVISIKKSNTTIGAILLLTAVISLSQLASAKDESLDASNTSISELSRKTELVSFVEEAVAYAQKNGKEKALDEFSNQNGSFVRNDLYIYAYDFNGTCLAHPFKPGWIGKDKRDVIDSNGVPCLNNTMNVAKEGKGFTYFIFPNPAHDNRDEFKIAYAMKVDDNWFLGSGIYISCF